MGFDYIVKVALLSCGSWSLGVEYLFWSVQAFFVDGCSAVVILVFSGGDELKSFYSTVLSLSLCHLLA